MSDLRQMFFDEMGKLAEKDDKVIVLVGDLGYSFMEEYAQVHRHQFINCGIAEQNMIGVAAGMALGGWKPYVYSGSMFLAARAYEQIRDDIAYADLDVKLIGTGASGFLGFSHNWGETESPRTLIDPLPNIEYVQTSEKMLPVHLNQKGPLFIHL